MTRGVSLGTLVNDLRAEVVQSVSAAAGISYRATLVRKLQGVQAFLYHDFAWPFLALRAPDISLAFQSRYYDIPSPLTLETLNTVQVYWGGVWSKPLPRGINMDHYNTFNSDNLVTVDPVRRWDTRYTGTKEQLEVWPMPQANGTLLRCHGTQPLATFIADADLATLDSDLLIFTAAAEILERAKTADATAVRSKATSIYNRLKGRTSHSSNSYSFADTPSEEPVSRVPNVAYVR